MWRDEWRYFLTALMFFTRVPVQLRDYRETDLNRSTRYFPLIGVLVGAVAAAVFWLAGQLVPYDIAILLSMIATILLTGAFHEDGLADAADGLGGGVDKAQALTIMQDSRIGSYGAIVLVMALLLKFHLLALIRPDVLMLALIAGHSLSRYMAVLVIATQSYVRSSGKSKPLATRLQSGDVLLASLFGLLPVIWMGLHLGEGLLAYVLLPVLVMWAWFGYKLHRRLGGYTGDCLGATQQLTELAFYLGVLAWSVA